MSCAGVYLYALSIELWVPAEGNSYPPVYSQTYFYLDGDTNSNPMVKMQQYFDNNITYPTPNGKPLACISPTDLNVYIPTTQIDENNFIVVSCWVVSEGDDIQNFQGSVGFVDNDGILLTEINTLGNGFGEQSTAAGDFEIYTDTTLMSKGRIISFAFPMNGDIVTHFNDSNMVITIDTLLQEGEG